MLEIGDVDRVIIYWDLGGALFLFISWPALRARNFYRHKPVERHIMETVGAGFILLSFALVVLGLTAGRNGTALVGGSLAVAHGLILNGFMRRARMG